MELRRRKRSHDANMMMTENRKKETLIHGNIRQVHRRRRKEINASLNPRCFLHGLRGFRQGSSTPVRNGISPVRSDTGRVRAGEARRPRLDVAEDGDQLGPPGIGLMFHDRVGKVRVEEVQALISAQHMAKLIPSTTGPSFGLNVA